MNDVVEIRQAESPLTAAARCVFVNRYYYPDLSATSQLLTDLTRATQAAGLETIVVTSRAEYDNKNVRLPPEERIADVRVLRVWTTRFGRHHLVGRAADYLSFYLGAFISLLCLVRSKDVVVAKTDPPLLSVMVALVCRIRNARLINWLQDVFPEVAVRLGVLPAGVVFGMIRALRNWSLRIAHLNVVIGERMAKVLCAEGIAPDSIAIIQNWADGEMVRPLDPAANPLRVEWGLENRFVVGYSGNLGRAHDTVTLLAAARILETETDIVFLLIGGGAGSDGLREQARKSGLQNFQFQPYQARSRLAQSLGVPDVHLVSLRPELEGLIVPSKIYGICAAGRPCLFIGSPEGDVAEMLTQDGFGLTVHPGDGEGLAEAIRELRDNCDLRRKLSLAARNSFEMRYSRERAMAIWWRVLSNVATDSFNSAALASSKRS